jgi:hypothetical protein
MKFRRRVIPVSQLQALLGGQSQYHAAIRIDPAVVKRGSSCAQPLAKRTERRQRVASHDGFGWRDTEAGSV